MKIKDNSSALCAYMLDLVGVTIYNGIKILNLFNVVTGKQSLTAT